MPSTLQELRERALRLTNEERTDLVEVLLASIEPVVHEAWRDEIERRVEAWESGRSRVIDGDEVFSAARKITA